MKSYKFRQAAENKLPAWRISNIITCLPELVIKKKPPRSASFSYLFYSLHFPISKSGGHNYTIYPYRSASHFCPGEQSACSKVLLSTRAATQLTADTVKAKILLSLPVPYHNPDDWQPLIHIQHSEQYPLCQCRQPPG